MELTPLTDGWKLLDMLRIIWWSSWTARVVVIFFLVCGLASVWLQVDRKRGEGLNQLFSKYHRPVFFVMLGLALLFLLLLVRESRRPASQDTRSEDLTRRV